MREYLVTLLLAAALCYVVTPLVRTWALKFGAVAHIRTRDVHTTPTPRWGGLAMWIAMALTFAMVNHLSLVGKSFGRETLGIFLAATLLVFIGLIDDRFELDALTKLAGQALAAGILLLHGIQVLWLPINGVITLPPSIGQLVTVLIVLVTINAVNFIDGLDGLAACLAPAVDVDQETRAQHHRQRRVPGNRTPLRHVLNRPVTGSVLRVLLRPWQPASRSRWGASRR